MNSRSWKIPRRTALKGLGVTLGLPLLEAMTPVASANAPAGRPVRLLFIFVPGGVNVDAWTPRGDGADYEASQTLAALAPVRSDARALVVRNLERAEDIDPAALAEGIEWGWETFPDFLEAVDRVPKGINYAANIGHSALRTWAMGERAFEETANADDLALMAKQLEAALRAGAIGFTTSRSRHHETSDNRPVASRLADLEELKALAQVMSDVLDGVDQGDDDEDDHGD